MQSVTDVADKLKSDAPERSGLELKVEQLRTEWGGLQDLLLAREETLMSSSKLQQ